MKKFLEQERELFEFMEKMKKNDRYIMWMWAFFAVAFVSLELYRYFW